MVASIASVETTNHRAARITLARKPVVAPRRTDCIRSAANQMRGTNGLSKLPASSAPGSHGSVCSPS
jgi:hypothetical protein